MKMWKKRWFVLSDMCLFYYKGEPSIYLSIHLSDSVIRTSVSNDSPSQASIRKTAILCVKFAAIRTTVLSPQMKKKKGSSGASFYPASTSPCYLWMTT